MPSSQAFASHIHPGLARLLAEYQPKPGALFPGMRGISPTLTRFMADKILRDATLRVGLEGISTHSFRRTALTMMKARWYPFARHSGGIGAQRSGDIAALFGSVTRAEAICCCGESGFDVSEHIS